MRCTKYYLPIHCGNQFTETHCNPPTTSLLHTSLSWGQGWRVGLESNLVLLQWECKMESEIAPATSCCSSTLLLSGQLSGPLRTLPLSLVTMTLGHLISGGSPPHYLHITHSLLKTIEFGLSWQWGSCWVPWPSMDYFLGHHFPLIWGRKNFKILILPLSTFRSFEFPWLLISLTAYFQFVQGQIINSVQWNKAARTH